MEDYIISEWMSEDDITKESLFIKVEHCAMFCDYSFYCFVKDKNDLIGFACTVFYNYIEMQYDNDIQLYLLEEHGVEFTNDEEVDDFVKNFLDKHIEVIRKTNSIQVWEDQLKSLVSERSAYIIHPIGSLLGNPEKIIDLLNIYPDDYPDLDKIQDFNSPNGKKILVKELQKHTP